MENPPTRVVRAEKFSAMMQSGNWQEVQDFDTAPQYRASSTAVDPAYRLGQAAEHIRYLLGLIESLDYPSYNERYGEGL